MGVNRISVNRLHASICLAVSLLVSCFINHNANYVYSYVPIDCNKFTITFMLTVYSIDTIQLSQEWVVTNFLLQFICTVKT